MKKHKSGTGKSGGKTGKAMSNISTAKMHKPAESNLEGLEGLYRGGGSKRRAKRLEGKSL